MLRSSLLLVVLGACSRPPDFKALCEKVAACEGKTVEGCVDDRARLWREQKKRGCDDEGAELVTCEIEHGRCETSGSWSLFMPTESCRPELDRFAECLRKSR